MLDVSNDVRGLLAFDAVADHSSGENGILAHVFKGATAPQFADQINSATQRHVVALGVQFATDHAAVYTGGLRIPASGGAQVGGHRGRVASIARAETNTIGSIVHLDQRNAQTRHTQHKSSTTVAQVCIRHRFAFPAEHSLTVEQANLFVQCHLLQHHVRPLIRRQARVHPWTRRCRLIRDGVGRIVASMLGERWGHQRRNRKDREEFQTGKIMHAGLQYPVDQIFHATSSYRGRL